MNERIKELAEKAEKFADVFCESIGDDDRNHWGDAFNDRFAELIVHDFLGELTNDDSLGEARIATIRRLAEKWGVAR